MVALFNFLAKQTSGDRKAFRLEFNGKTGFPLIPADMAGLVPERRPDRNDELTLQGIRKAWKCDFTSADISSAIQFNISGDSYSGGFAPGESMMNSGSVQKLNFVSLDEIPDGRILIMRDERGLELKQTYRYTEGDRFIRIHTSITNHAMEPVNLEYLATFALDQLSLFQPDAGTECYDLIRWRSNWSNEGRIEPRPIEEPGLIPLEF